MKEAETNAVGMDSRRIETVIITPDVSNTAVAAAAIPVTEAEPVLDETVEETVEEAVEVWVEEEAEPVMQPLFFVWPVQGELERTHDTENLSYDITLRDWRTHEGVDICAPLGSTVCAAHAGTVESIVEDGLYGTVVTVVSADGTSSIYANLAALPAVSVDDWVDAGDIIGSVGDTALCEIGQSTHLHFAMLIDGESVDPLDFLPA